MEPRYNKPLYSKVLGITNDFLHPRNSKIYGKEPGYNQTLLKRTNNFASPLALCYINLPLYFQKILRKSGKQFDDEPEQKEQFVFSYLTNFVSAKGE